MITCTCKYCNREYPKNQIGGHTAFCTNNPNREKNLIRLGEARKNVKYTNEKYVCEYCGKILNNKGNLIHHTKHCKENPNHIISSDEKAKKNRKSRKGICYKNKMSDEGRKNISIARKKYLAEHKDEHVWKRNNKFVSKPCEYLKEEFRKNNINFVEEYSPFDDYAYAIDIAWPDIKVGIEINGNQHYNNDGSLKEYYKNRHDIFESRGWKLYELHYTKCYKINVIDFITSENLDLFDKDYVGKYFSDKELKKLKREENMKKKQERIESKNILYKQRREALIDLETKSNIDFSKFGWVNLAKEYMENNYPSIPVKQLHRLIKYYYPEFFENNTVFMRKGTVI